MDGMKRVRGCLLIIVMFFAENATAQWDSTYLFLDKLEIHFTDSTEHIESIVFQNSKNALVFRDTSGVKQVGIKRRDTCSLYIRTNYSTLRLENINEYLEFEETKFKLSIWCPKHHMDCVSAVYMRPDGLELFHGQTMTAYDSGVDFTHCAEVYGAPIGYRDFNYKYYLE
jgi:hypothetical protein